MRTIWEKTVKKLTTEQLLFAHRIGATHFRNNNSEMLYRKRDDGWQCTGLDSVEWTMSLMPDSEINDYIHAIDFTPLYDWIDHDGGECPVRNSDVVIVREQGSHLEYAAQAVSVDWSKNLTFKLSGASADWPEQRADAIGQNGNDGGHYAEAPETDTSDGSTASYYELPEGATELHLGGG